MSGKTRVGTETAALGHEGTDDEQTLRELVADDVSGEVETVVYRENAGTLDDPEEEWRHYDSLAELPEQPVDGWDELYAYTDTHVYRWVGVGFATGPERLPRGPETLPTGN